MRIGFLGCGVSCLAGIWVLVAGFRFAPLLVWGLVIWCSLAVFFWMLYNVACGGVCYAGFGWWTVFAGWLRKLGFVDAVYLCVRYYDSVFSVGYVCGARVFVFGNGFGFG